MAKTPLAAVILAAGKGTRMKSALPKVLHEVGGAPLVAYPIQLANQLKATPTVVVVGHEAERVEQQIEGLFPSKCKFRLQAEQRGTGHAVMQAMKSLRGFDGVVLVLSGDVPLLTAPTMRKIVRKMTRTKAAVVAATMIPDNPFGYGRIVHEDGQFARVVEHKDCSKEELEVREVNAGIYAFDAGFLRKSLKKLNTNNAQGEYYLPDLVEMAFAKKLGTQTVVVEDPTEVLGVNDRTQLARVGEILRERTNFALMKAGVTLRDPATTYVDSDVKIGSDTILHPNVHVRAGSKIGKGCVIETGVVITNSKLGNGIHVKPHSVIDDAEVRANATIGPFARLRPGALILERGHVGNFVELKKTTLGKGAKANHLAYLGDSEIGPGANIGAGTITCNYDGFGKYKTEIGARTFVGSNSTLVAPLKLRNDVYVAAGSTVTKDAKADSLVVGRARQVEKEGRAALIRKTAQKRAAAAKAKKNGKG